MVSPFATLLKYNFKARTTKVSASENPFMTDEEREKRQQEIREQAADTALPVAIDVRRIVCIEETSDIPIYIADDGVGEEEPARTWPDRVSITVSTGSYDKVIDVEGPFDSVFDMITDLIDNLPESS